MEKKVNKLSDENIKNLNENICKIGLIFKLLAKCFLYHILQAFSEVAPGCPFEGDLTIFIAKCNTPPFHVK